MTCVHLQKSQSMVPASGTAAFDLLAELLPGPNGTERLGREEGLRRLPPRAALMQVEVGPFVLWYLTALGE